MTPFNEAENELSQLFPLPHIPHFVPFPLTQAETIAETQRVRELFPEFFPPHKYILFFSPFCRKFPSTTPDPRWPFSKMYYFRGDDRGWDGWMASLTWWTWVWVNSGSWWWTGRPGVLQFMGSQRVGHDWATELSYFREKLLLFMKVIFLNFISRIKWWIQR